MAKVHFIQHVAFETPGSISTWARNHNFNCRTTVLSDGADLPQIEDFDLLVIMGGPMSANDDAQYSWMKKEKELVHACLELKKPIVGICLGAQIIANVLGSKVYAAKEKEIGWWPITASTDNRHSKLMHQLPSEFTVFHWHGETFDLPAGSRLLASTPACPNQAFEFNDHVLGLQFHMEVTRDEVNSMWENCRADLGNGTYQQHPPDLFGTSELYSNLKLQLEQTLDNLVQIARV